MTQQNYPQLISNFHSSYHSQKYFDSHIYAAARRKKIIELGHTPENWIKMTKVNETEGLVIPNQRRKKLFLVSIFCSFSNHTILREEKNF